MPAADDLLLASNNALHRAFQQNKAAYPRRSTYVQEHATFFQTPARGDSDPPAHRLTIGTDCSGMEAPLQALANMKIPHDHLFSCDHDPSVQATIRANFAPRILFEDLLTRDNNLAPAVDVYVAGFPCQPFSIGGKQQGFEDNKGRGIIFWSIREYIDLKRPKIFILENVRGLTSLQEGRYLSQILQSLRSIGSSTEQNSSEKSGAYQIYHKVLNTRENGIPQHRERWYCVGIRKSCLRTPVHKYFA